MVYLTIIAVLLAVSSSTIAQEEVTPTQFGMEMSTRAYEAVCWYEFQKKFPVTNTKLFNKCSSQAEQKNDDIKKRIPANQQQKYFSDWIPDIMTELPSEYNSKCKSLLQSGTSESSDNEGETLSDQGITAYPFRAFAYCLMKTLRERNGNEAIEDVKNERIYHSKYWMKTLIDRVNRFRALHGAPALIPEKILTERAQKWSEKSAANCDDVHISHTDPEYNFQNKPTGENLHAGYRAGKEGDKSDHAYSAANGWYQEIYNYNWSDRSRNGTVGHFTQLVWKKSTHVGYGYAFNQACNGGMGKYFITARFYPAGNYPGEDVENVSPPNPKFY